MEKPTLDDWHARPVCIYWPEYFHSGYFNRMPCNKCGRGDSVIQQGWNAEGPRIVSSLHNEYYVLCRRYKCKKCNSTFSGYDRDVQKHLPLDIQSTLPCVVYPKTALDKNDIVLLSRQVVKCGSFADFRKQYIECNTDRFLRCVLNYVSHEKRRRTRIFHGLGPADDFGKYDDANGYNGSPPPLGTLRAAYKEHSEPQQQFRCNDMASQTGEVCSGDHTFQLAKKVKVGGEHCSQTLYSVSSEKNIIMGCYLTETVSLKEVESQLQMMNERDGMGNKGNPKVFYDDLCCGSSKVLEKTFPSLQSGFEKQKQSLPVVKFPNAAIQILNTVDAVNEACDKLQKSSAFLGFDTEYEVSFLKDHPQTKTAIIQLCSADMCVIIQLHLLPSIPRNLKSLLANFNNKKVGVCSKADATRLHNDYQFLFQTQK